jgi:NAD(P) transhydrogenase subunit alpha
MKIGVPAETRPGESRVAATPETVKKLVGGKHQLVVQAGAGIPASFTDDATPPPARRSAVQPTRSGPTWC